MNGFQEISWPLLGLVAARMGGMMLAAPFWGSNVITMRFRIAICTVFAVALVPLVSQSHQAEFHSIGEWINLMIGELIGGALFGLGVHIVFKSMMIAGEMIGLPLGLRVQAGPTSEPTALGSSTTEAATSTGRLFDFVAIASFVLIGGPSFLVHSIVQSYTDQPIGTFANSAADIQFLMSLIPAAFLLGLKIALPILVCQLLALLTVGVISRTLPQVSTFQIGMPLAYSATLVAILFSVGTMTLMFGEQMETLTENLLQNLSETPGESDTASAIDRRVVVGGAMDG